MRTATSLLLAGALLCGASSGLAQQRIAGELKVEILSPAHGEFLQGDQRSVMVDGGASSFGGIRHLDMMFVLDSSKSLYRTDPEHFLSAGAAGLIENLHAKSDIQIGVVSFDFEARLLQPLSKNRAEAIEKLNNMVRDGGTDIADGIETAVAELEANARPDSTRVLMLFTDGKSNERKARKAMEQARERGIVVHTLLLGEDEEGMVIMREIAGGTGGSFVQVTDPASLPDAFLNLKTTGVDSVALVVNDGSPIPARLAGGSFSAEVPLQHGENRIMAVATALDGSTATTEVRIVSGPPNCGSLEMHAFRNGLPTISIEDRAIQIVVDASRSMWGRMEGEPKMVVAKETLLDMSQSLTPDSNLALRAYGNRSKSEAKDCNDSELLVGFGRNNRYEIGSAIEGLSPLGQTPLAYALNQAGHDFEGIEGEKAIVLVTDGIESCGGDPLAEASRLWNQGIAIHVIGFGLANAKDEDTASLDAIAQAGSGRFFMAGSSAELKSALAGTVGTAYRIFEGPRVVASGVLGSDEPILLPEGEYLLQLESSPPRELPLTLLPGEKLTLSLEKYNQQFMNRQQRETVGQNALVNVGCPIHGGVS